VRREGVLVGNAVSSSNEGVLTSEELIVAFSALLTLPSFPTRTPSRRTCDNFSYALCASSCFVPVTEKNVLL
jgi:hypothetical protein